MSLLGSKEELTGINIKGRLIHEYNNDFNQYVNTLDAGFNMIKKIYFKIIDEESIIKLQNIISRWKTKNPTFKIPIYQSERNAYIICLTSQKFMWHVGPKMMNDKKNKKDWYNKSFDIKFDVKKHKFPQQNTIEGLQFILKYIDLEI